MPSGLSCEGKAVAIRAKIMISFISSYQLSIAVPSIPLSKDVDSPFLFYKVKLPVK